MSRSDPQDVGTEKETGAVPTEPQTSAEAGGALRGRLASSPTQGAPGEREDAPVVAYPAGRTLSGRSQAVETSSESAQRSESEGAGSGEAPGTPPGGGVLPVREDTPRLEDVDRRAERTAERLVAACFLATAVSSLLFAVVYFLSEPTDSFFIGDTEFVYHTPLLGLLLAIGLTGLGVGPVLWAKKLMVDEEAVQEREVLRSSDDEREAAVSTFSEGLGNTGFGRRSLVRNSLLLGGATIVLPLALPLLSLGRFQFKEEALRTTNWAAGLRAVRIDGSPVVAGALEFGSLLTVYPEGHTTQQDQADAATLLIRLRPGEDDPLPGREDWSVNGIVAYSKICTHAGCPVGLYEQRTHHLLCPCHQSTFLLTEHARPIFGPAARPLPQLRLAVDDEGFLVARGDYDEPTGPAFWERA